MGLSPRLDVRQSQSLVMTPQLQQAIKLLQYSNVELAEYVEGELQQNPLLERGDNDGPASLEVLDNMSAYDAATERERTPAEDSVGWDASDGPETVEQTASSSLPADGDDPRDTDYSNDWSSAGISETDPGHAGADGGLGAWQTSNRRGGFDDDGFDLEGSLADSKSLKDHLLDQLTIDLSDPVERAIGAYLVEMVDDAGYLRGDLGEVSEALGCDDATVEAVVGKLQRLDPPGVCARSLTECLALQLADRNRLDPAIQALLDNIDMLAARDMPGLRRVCGVDDEDLIEMIEEIRSLDPKPGLAFEPVDTEAVIPDVLIRRSPSQDWIIELNTDALPRVLVNNSYHATVAKSVKRKEDRGYLAECLQSANWLVRSLHQRATTILKVSTEIVRQQNDFFEYGIHHLKPLVLKDVAEAIGMHESTVSRVTSNKYVSTPRGLFELKYFFTSAIASAAGGDAHSAEAVKARIRSLIDNEDPKRVLSDDKIVDLLRGQGIDIARRTVAKYREAMRISSSVQRRREKSFALRA
jgi:RNA polymerase sigma-54 factor